MTGHEKLGQKQILRFWFEGIVLLTLKLFTFKLDSGKVVICDFYFRWISVGVNRGFHLKAFVGSGIGNQVGGRLLAYQGFPSPVLGDESK